MSSTRLMGTSWPTAVNGEKLSACKWSHREAPATTPHARNGRCFPGPSRTPRHAACLPCAMRRVAESVRASQAARQIQVGRVVDRPILHEDCEGRLHAKFRPMQPVHDHKTVDLPPPRDHFTPIAEFSRLKLSPACLATTLSPSKAIANMDVPVSTTSQKMRRAATFRNALRTCICHPFVLTRDCIAEGCTRGADIGLDAGCSAPSQARLPLIDLLQGSAASFEGRGTLNCSGLLHGQGHGSHCRRCA